VIPCTVASDSAGHEQVHHGDELVLGEPVRLGLDQGREQGVAGGPALRAQERAHEAHGLRQSEEQRVQHARR
jgi:hypothetical protein